MLALVACHSCCRTGCPRLSQALALCHSCCRTGCPRLCHALALCHSCCRTGCPRLSHALALCHSCCRTGCPRLSHALASLQSQFTMTLHGKSAVEISYSYEQSLSPCECGCVRSCMGACKFCQANSEKKIIRKIDQCYTAKQHKLLVLFFSFLTVSCLVLIVYSTQ